MKLKRGTMMKVGIHDGAHRDKNHTLRSIWVYHLDQLSRYINALDFSCVKQSSIMYSMKS